MPPRRINLNTRVVIWGTNFSEDGISDKRKTWVIARKASSIILLYFECKESVRMAMKGSTMLRCVSFLWSILHRLNIKVKS